MITTNDHDLATQYYLDRLKDGPVKDKLIQNYINNKFDVSAVAIRNKLVEDGFIKVEVLEGTPKGVRKVFISSLTDASKTKIKPKVVEKKMQSIVIDTHWPEGWKKSRNNAFDWKKTAKGLFSKQELAAMQAKIKANPSFTQTTNVYSRA